MLTDASLPLFNWLTQRGAGVLLHPTALPGPHGVGTLDGHAIRFLDFLQAAGISHWQICPLGPTGFGDSPYQSFSAFAGNPYLIDLGDLAGHGLLSPEELAPLAALPADQVDFGALFRLKWPLLDRAQARYEQDGCPPIYGDYATFRRAQADWLEDYAYFRSLKDHHQGQPWWDWPQGLRRHGQAMRSTLRKELAPAIEVQIFAQYVVHGQWQRIRAAATERNIAIIGDLPIFVAADSADVWARPELFELDPATGKPVAVAGVPPDYFSADGQLWGNPLYRWEQHAADGFAWWIERLRAAFTQADIVRIDHFRGFDEYWRVPLPASNARAGEWTPAPGLDLFRAVRAALPDARIIAEDLGLLKPSVIELREATGLPGMAVLQFAFGGEADNLYLPHNLTANSVIYPGTHDNDTTLGWYAGAEEKTRDHARRYLRVDGQEIGWDFIRAAYASVSRLAVIPFQDILCLGSEARFNSPGTAQGNWTWRCRAESIEDRFAETVPYLASLAALYGRQ